MRVLVKSSDESYVLSARIALEAAGIPFVAQDRAGGPYVRVELGPRGRPDVLSGYAVLQFVMTSSAPWPEFPELRAHLDEFFDEYSELLAKHGHGRHDAPPGARLMQLRMFYIPDEPAEPEP